MLEVVYGVGGSSIFDVNEAARLANYQVCKGKKLVWPTVRPTIVNISGDFLAFGYWNSRILIARGRS